MDQQVSLSLEMSEQEEEAEEEEIKTKEVQGKVEEEKASHGKPLLKAVMEMDGSAQGCKSQEQHMIKVKMSSNTPNQRIYDKKNFCLYCEKPYAKITRHLKQKHSGEGEIAKALSYKQGSSMQKGTWEITTIIVQSYPPEKGRSYQKGKQCICQQQLTICLASFALLCMSKQTSGDTISVAN